MADIKVVYFDEFRGRGEFLRMLLVAAGQKFEDVRIKFENWGPEAKKETPYGQIPYVVYKGKKHGQSVAIATYLAKKFGFYGKTDEDALKQEEVMHLVEDLRVPHVRDWFFAKEPAKKDELSKKLVEELFPRYLGYFEALLAENGDKGLFVGSSVTMADMYLYDFVETMLGISGEALKSFPLLQKLVQNVKVFPALKDYLASRPKTMI
ncbi:glutathione S-transferase 3-like [Babylonia areolata]|uniref:glutathione S-transferase 3-like n=1 Tax=Babylonia areolata TaxID=304850 RepID=UPI003FD3DF15